MKTVKIHCTLRGLIFVGLIWNATKYSRFLWFAKYHNFDIRKNKFRKFSRIFNLPWAECCRLKCVEEIDDDEWVLLKICARFWLFIKKDKQKQNVFYHLSWNLIPKNFTIRRNKSRKILFGCGIGKNKSRKIRYFRVTNSQKWILAKMNPLKVIFYCSIGDKNESTAKCLGTIPLIPPITKCDQYCHSSTSLLRRLAFILMNERMDLKRIFRDH